MTPGINSEFATLPILYTENPIRTRQGTRIWLTFRPPSPLDTPLSSIALLTNSPMKFSQLYRRWQSRQAVQKKCHKVDPPLDLIVIR